MLTTNAYNLLLNLLDGGPAAGRLRDGGLALVNLVTGARGFISGVSRNDLCALIDADVIDLEWVGDLGCMKVASNVPTPRLPEETVLPVQARPRLTPASLLDALKARKTPTGWKVRGVATSYTTQRPLPGPDHCHYVRSDAYVQTRREPTEAEAIAAFRDDMISCGHSDVRDLSAVPIYAD